MRKFRFVGDPDDYKVNEAEFKVGEIYNGDFVGKDCLCTVEQYASKSWCTSDWQEVFEEQAKPLHKDTDLGHFSGLAMQGYIAAGSTGMPTPDRIVKYAIETAQELIKQLDQKINETK